VTRDRFGVFLDRDGTLVPDAVHATRPGQLRLYAAAGRALRELAGAGARLALVSNQSAVARGMLDAGGLREMDRALADLLRAESVVLDRSYYCPHHPEFTGPCRCRKPAPGMILDGLRDLGLRAGNGYLVGDTGHDMEAGRAAGVATVLVLTGHGRRERAGAQDRGLVDHVTANLAGAARWILARRRGISGRSSA